MGRVKNPGSIGVNRFIILSFLIMGWAYWELSGGADFRPEPWPVAERQAAGAPATNLVTRADTTTLATIDRIVPSSMEAAPGVIAASDVASDPMEPLAAQLTPEEPATAEFIAESVAAALAEQAAPEIGAVDAELVIAATDLREVNGDRVNLRQGPGTDFGVVDQLVRGTVIEVIEVGGDGWVRVRVDGSGRSGWMSDQFLVALNG
jgi:hypothetical protein